ncbi:iron-containing alcohol dehydrogenase [Zavarzinia sp. CC-PAN008]|uniref:iron-containing alcohol dehydrogenase n=1 Tax=Zavarzinia sp. CC-PAN008 TaxID=3243332 RepID=UPI003F749884
MIRSTEIAWPAVERVVLGRPAATAIPEAMDRLGVSRALLVTSNALNTRTDEVERIRAALGARHAATFDSVPAHAPRGAVVAAANLARSVQADVIVTVGGGSVTDAGKIVPMCLKHDVTTAEGMDAFRLRVDADGTMANARWAAPDIRTIAVPTTLSGGEFNALSGATDEVTRLKQGYEHRLLTPVCVILDPALTRHTPEWLWFSTGVRALDHALEALGSLQSNDFADGIADNALRLLIEGLTRVKADPGDIEARLKCQVGAWQSMLPLVGGVPMGASHAIGHVLGGSFGVPHGYTSCVMAPYVLAFNAEVNEARQKRISACFGQLDVPAFRLVDDFIRNLGMPRTLREVGISVDNLDTIARNTMYDPWGRTNPRTIFGPADVRQILESAL